jgi:rhodanese-related sulfurtransferase
MATDRTTPAEVGPEEADHLVAAGALLLDVREDDEWEAGHIDGAVHIPLGQLAARIEELAGEREVAGEHRVPGGDRVVVVCRSGARSAHATAFLSASGVAAVNLAGGMRAWAAAGLPFEAADGSPGVVA